MIRCRNALASTLIGLGLAVSQAQAAPPSCTDAMTAELPQPHSYSWGEPDSPMAKALRRSKEDDTVIALFEPPAVKQPYGSRTRFGFNLKFAVDEQGSVTCATLTPNYGDTAPVMDPQRQVFLDDVAAWRFKPFLICGQASAFVVKWQINEEERPQTHIPAPEGDPRHVTITQDVRPTWASFGPYHVELHGNGTAIYTSGDPDDPLGPQSYLVDPEAVQALVAKAVEADFWSLRDLYRGSPNADSDGRSFDRLNITLGGVTKSLTSHTSRDSGLPQTADTLQSQTMFAAQIEFWQTPTLATLDQLRLNGYDFTEARAGTLLLKMTQNPGVKEDAILALMDLGAPTDKSGDNGYLREWQDMIDAALASGRTTVATRLIADGALLDAKGRPDRIQIEWAFRNAIRSGRPGPVELLLPYKPAMTFRDFDTGEKVSVILYLAGAKAPAEDRIAVAKRLLALGADINARDGEGRTLLNQIAGDSEDKFVLFLLENGARINVTDKEGRTPLSQAFSEDLSLLLLERGANPRLGKSPQDLRFNVRHNNWRRVKAWLMANGYKDVLIPVPGEE